MRYRFSNPFNPGRALHSYRMLQLLEVKKLPVAGMPARMLPGISSDGKPVEIMVWVIALVGEAKRSPSGYAHKRSTHRVFCQCPGCGKGLSAGRLFQHVCPTGKDRALESARRQLGFAPHAPTYTCDCSECRAARASPSNPHGYVSRREEP